MNVLLHSVSVQCPFTHCTQYEYNNAGFRLFVKEIILKGNIKRDVKNNSDSILFGLWIYDGMWSVP